MGATLASGARAERVAQPAGAALAPWAIGAPELPVVTWPLGAFAGAGAEPVVPAAGAPLGPLVPEAGALPAPPGAAAVPADPEIVPALGLPPLGVPVPVPVAAPVPGVVVPGSVAGSSGACRPPVVGS
jgi:hypothetical protein